MIILKLMRLALIIIAFLAAFFPIYINTSLFATNAQLTALEDLKTYNISFFIKADLNNDGIEERATIYRQWDGEGWYSDDVWYVISIFDEDYHLLYKSDVSHFHEVDSFSVRDTDGDGLKELIVSLNASQHFLPKTYTYGWRGDGYGVVERE